MAILADDIFRCIFMNENFLAITWTNAEPVHWCIYGTLGGDDFKQTVLESVGGWKPTGFLVIDGFVFSRQQCSMLRPLFFALEIATILHGRNVLGTWGPFTNMD